MGRLSRRAQYGTSRRQRAHLSHYLGWPRAFGGLGRGSQRDAAPAFTDHLLQSIPLIRLEVAQLILHVVAVLARKLHQLFGVDVQFARQGVHSDFLTVLVQAG
jgi:hypothetical protein